jgi:hypothetical protein
MIYRRSLKMTLWSLVLLTMLASFLLSSLFQVSFAQLSSSSPQMPLTQQQGEGANQLVELEAARQQYLSAWNNTAFSSQFDVFIAEGTLSGYGMYIEHVPTNVFRPGETMVLYVEPVGFGHQPIPDASSRNGVNSTETSRNLYLINMTADIIISGSTESQRLNFEDVPVANLNSHIQNTEIPMTLTISQEQPFAVGDYIITYIVHDQVTGQSFQIDKSITIDDNAVTGASPLPQITNDNSMQSVLPQQQLEERSQALER